MTFYIQFASKGHKTLLHLLKKSAETQTGAPPEALTFIERAIKSHPDGTIISVVAMGHSPSESDAQYHTPAKMDITVSPMAFTEPMAEDE